MVNYRDFFVKVSLRVIHLRYPDKLAWQMNLTRKDIRRVEAYYKLHNFLITETDNGTISRQETVSMIPPLVLNIEPHHKVHIVFFLERN